MHRALLLIPLLLALSACRSHRYSETMEQVPDAAVYEGHPVENLPPTQPIRQRPVTPPATTTTTTTTSQPPLSETQMTARPSVTPKGTPKPVAAAEQFPTAKPVPGKPGFVYSPYDGAMIDVTGFSSGSKAKDPATNKIFIVP